MRDGDLPRVVRIFESDLSLLNIETPFGSWLHVAASFGKIDILKWLLEKGMNINRKGGISGGSAINVAAGKGQFAAVKFLLECGAELDVSEPERNPLFGAICGGHVDTANLLIKSGIDIHVKYTGDNMKNTDALAFAEAYELKEVVQLLKSKLKRGK